MRRTILLATACLASACTERDRPAPASAEPPIRAPSTPAAQAPLPTSTPEPVGTQAASAPCEQEALVRVTTPGTGPKPALKLEPDPGHGEALRVGEPDLDGRGRTDLYVLFPTDFGSDGAQVQALYVHCSGDLYAPVWGPEYTLELKFLETHSNGWRDVLRREKVVTPGAPATQRIKMRFQDGAYQDQGSETEKP